MLACRNHPDVIEGVRHCSRCGGEFCRDCTVTIGDRLYCATCKNEQLLDVRSGFDRSRLNLAGLLKRFVAIFIDYLIFNLPLYFILFRTIITQFRTPGYQPSPYFNFLGLPVTVAIIVYEALMLRYRNGQTLGKMALKIRVVQPDGSPLTTGQCWGRAGMRAVLGCLIIVDYIPAFFTDEKTTLHDMAASTRVVELY